MTERARWAVMPAWMIDNHLAEMDGSMVKVYLYLSRWADKHGTLWHSQERIATACGISRRTVITAVQKLVAMGALKSSKRTRTSCIYSLGTIGRSGKYEGEPDFTPEQDVKPTSQLDVKPTSLDPVKPTSHKVTTDEVTTDEVKNTPPSVVVSPSADPDKEFLLSLIKKNAPDHPAWMSPETASRATTELAKIERTLVQSVQSYYAGPTFTGKPEEQKYKQWLSLELRSHAMNKPLPVREVVRADTPKTLVEAFELFWQAYPKKQKRTEALNEFTAAVKSGIAADLIISGAKRYSMAEGTKEPQYLPFPGTWLRDGRWSDVFKGKSWSHTASDD